MARARHQGWGKVGIQGYMAPDPAMRELPSRDNAASKVTLLSLSNPREGKA